MRKALEEGGCSLYDIETREDLQTVIGFGVDLIQGFYTAKPAPEPLAELSAELRNEIVMASSAVSV